MKLTNIEFKIPTKEILLGSEKVLVKQYLPAKEKSDILDAIKEFCFQEEIIDQPKIDALFNAFVVLNYTNIEFDSREVSELLSFYDYMEVNNYILPIIDVIPEIEYNALIGYYGSTIDDFNKFKISALATFANVVKFGPVLMEKIGEISKEIDVDAIKLIADISAKMN